MIDDIDMIRNFIKSRDDMEWGSTLKTSSDENAVLEYFIDDVAVYSIPGESEREYWYLAVHHDSEGPQKTYVIKKGTLLYNSPAVALAHPQKHFEISINTADGWSVEDIRKALEERNFIVISIKEEC